MINRQYHRTQNTEQHVLSALKISTEHTQSVSYNFVGKHEQERTKWSK